MSSPRPSPGKTVSWNICGTCNYGCSYCSQGKRHEGTPDAATVTAAARFLAGLGSEWEVKLSGGEPFTFDGLTAVVRGLASAGLGISVVTNFSYPAETYERFVKACADTLRIVSLSYHAEFVEWKDFLQKCLKFRESLAACPGASLVVNSVALPGAVERLLAVQDDCLYHGVRFYPQLERRKGAVTAYGTEDERAIERLVGNAENGIAFNAGTARTGTKCWAGSRYFVLTHTGDGYCCYPGKRSGDGYLGNVARGSLELRREPVLCPYDTCPCSVPAHRGILELG